MHVNTAHRGLGCQILQELELQCVVNCLSWVLRTELGPVQEQCLLLPAEPILQSPAILSISKERNMELGR